MLDSTLKQQLETYLQNLQTPVELVAYLDESRASQQLQSLVDDIAAMSGLINAQTKTDVAERNPSLLVRSIGGHEIRFAGLPMGHEFTSLVLALLHSGGHPMKIDPALIEQVRALDGQYQFETYIQLSCQTCPEVVQALNMMAAINPQISHVMIDGALFPEEVEAREIMAVPTVFLNQQPFSQGRMSLEKIIHKLDSKAAAKQAEQLAAKAPFDLLIVGAGPAGAAAAIYGARKGIRTGLITERMGGQVADTVGIENFISVQKTEGPKLVAALEAHVLDYEVDVLTEQQVSRLIPAADPDNYIAVELANGALLNSRSVLLATGARWRELGVPGEQQYRGRGVAYCPHCDGPLFKGKRVAVIGGGNSGIEAAIDLAGIVDHVTVLEFADRLLADDVLQRKAASMRNIDIVLMAQTTDVLGDGRRVTGVRYTDRVSGQSSEVKLDGIFVQIGLVPNTEFLHDSDLQLTSRGEIEVGDRGETNIPGVFAAGDVTTAPYKQIIVAMGAGSNAALAAFDYLIRTPEPAEALKQQAA